ncbi:hypothetical protein BC629DRAFT_1589069 [Irpex lacteus]|nr:hypothetical protein BC629DRAFT_1589069 [Irpex lacteus]
MSPLYIKTEILPLADADAADMQAQLSIKSFVDNDGGKTIEVAVVVFIRRKEVEENAQEDVMDVDVQEDDDVAMGEPE